MPISARAAGTKDPACAKRAIKAFWRKNVDLPAIFGPVSSQIISFVLVNWQSLAIKTVSACALIAASTTGWRPCSMIKSRLSFSTGRTQPSAIANSERAAATSISAIETAKACSAAAESNTSAQRPAKTSSSNSVARPAAFRILVSSSPSSTVVKRTALAVVCR